MVRPDGPACYTLLLTGGFDQPGSAVRARAFREVGFILVSAVVADHTPNQGRTRFLDLHPFFAPSGSWLIVNQAVEQAQRRVFSSTGWAWPDSGRGLVHGQNPTSVQVRKPRTRTCNASGVLNGQERPVRIPETRRTVKGLIYRRSLYTATGRLITVARGLPLLSVRGSVLLGGTPREPS